MALIINLFEFFHLSGLSLLTDRSKAVLLLWIIHVISVMCLLCFPVRLIIVALWTPDVKGLTSWLSFVMSNCVFVTFPLVYPESGAVLIVSIPDICPLSYFVNCTKLRCSSIPRDCFDLCKQCIP